MHQERAVPGVLLRSLLRALLLTARRWAEVYQGRVAQRARLPSPVWSSRPWGTMQVEVDSEMAVPLVLPQPWVGCSPLLARTLAIAQQGWLVRGVPPQFRLARFPLFARRQVGVHQESDAESRRTLLLAASHWEPHSGQMRATESCQGGQVPGPILQMRATECCQGGQVPGPILSRLCRI